MRSSALAQGDKWYIEEMVVTINGKKHWLWRAVDQRGALVDVQVQRHRDRYAAVRPMLKLLKRPGVQDARGRAACSDN